MKVETSSYGSLLVPLLNEKLANDIRFNLAPKLKNGVWKLDDILIFFKTEIEAKNRSISVGFSTVKVIKIATRAIQLRNYIFRYQRKYAHSAI